MAQDIEMVPGIAAASIRRENNGELVFSLSRALDVLALCTESRIAVLGVEIFPGLNVSSYDQQVIRNPDEKSWIDYVRASNALAEDFLRTNPASTASECILTTASWREFQELKESRRSLK